MPPKILLADDSVTVQKVIELTFHDEGMEVVAVGDGQKAIDCLERERPDIVLADVSMPERDGYAVAAHVKATPSLAHIPVVLMTGAFEQIDDARAREVGCNGVLNKPFEPQMVIALVRQLLAGEPVPASPPPAAAAVAGGFPFDAGVTPAPPRTLDDYFDRLDEALAARVSAPPPPRAEQTDEPIEASVPPAPPATSLADAFDALLADELGERPLPASWNAVAVAHPHGDPAPAAPAPLSLSDDQVDAIARRVVERLTDAVIREVADARVLEVAERVVRDEIDRVKAQA
jgi:CheY-like chemotaxis protein